MQFLEDVLGEVADLFPGEYIHIGGDECPRDEWATDPDCQAKIRELGLKDADGVSAESPVFAPGFRERGDGLFARGVHGFPDDVLNPLRVLPGFRRPQYPQA